MQSDEDRVRQARANFEGQRVMKLLGAALTKCEPGLCEIELPIRPEFGQNEGYVHAGILTTIVDSAGGYAAFTMMKDRDSILTSNYTLHFLAPARGERIIGRARCVRAGRTIAVCELEVMVVDRGTQTRVAWGSQTLIGIDGR